MEQCAFTTWLPRFFRACCGAGFQPANVPAGWKPAPRNTRDSKSLGPAWKLFEMNASRRLVYGIVIAAAVGSAVGRILSTQLVFEPSIHRDERNPDDRRRLW